MSAPKIIYTAEEAQALWQRGFDAGRAAVPPEGLRAAIIDAFLEGTGYTGDVPADAAERYAVVRLSDTGDTYPAPLSTDLAGDETSPPRSA